MTAYSVLWNPSKDLLSIGSFTIHWYSFLWLIGLGLAYIIVFRLYRRQQIPMEKFEPLFFYCFVGILLGARLGHCLLYDPGYFLSSFVPWLLHRCLKATHYPVSTTNFLEASSRTTRGTL